MQNQLLCHLANRVSLQIEDCSVDEQNDSKQKEDVSKLLGDNMQWNVVCTIDRLRSGPQVPAMNVCSTDVRFNR